MKGPLRSIRSIAIVGGGSSGWMAAAGLSKILSGIEVTVVESPTVPVIGVGEATIPFLRGFMTRIGFPDDRLWMAACDATYKTGILFENWRHPGHRYWHPFEYLDYFDRHTHSGHLWVSLHSASDPRFSDALSFYERFMCTLQVNVGGSRGPAMADYAYHLDAALFGDLLKDASNVRVIRDDVVDVVLNDAGEIGELRTRRHGPVHADLYVDCTGFRRILAGPVAPDNRFESYANSLFCDRAVVLRMPYTDDAGKTQELCPYVRATAADSGWIWSIPLNSKLSTGYVYSSRFATQEEALATLRRFWGEERTAGVTPLHVQFATGKYERLWTGNCVAIGLAGGFIEPLESTGLAITQIGVEMLMSILDTRCYDEEMSRRYDMHLQKFYSDIVQFIIAHYCFTERKDTPFWRAVRNETYVPPELAERLEIFRRYLPTTSTKGMAEVWMFRDVSWFCVLLGMGFDFRPHPVDRELLSQAPQFLEAKARTVAGLLERISTHRQCLHAIHG